MRPQRNPFWDQETDHEGRSIRRDVRDAAIEVWDKACRMTERLLGDVAEAAEIMESCVARVSRHLNERNQELFTQQTCALLWVAFRNALRSRVQKRRRLQFVTDANALESRDAACTWEREIELNLDLAKIVRQLSARSRIILRLRDAGYRWIEVAALLGVTVPSVKSTFWREIEDLRVKVVKEQQRRAAHAPEPVAKPSKGLKKAVPAESRQEPSGPDPDVALIFSSRPPPSGIGVVYNCG